MGQPADYPLGGGIAQFVDDDLLRYTLADGTNRQYYLRAPNTWQTNYLALGDSYASGEGANSSKFFAGTDVRDVNMCHLSKVSYPFLIGKDLNLTSTHSVACSGAKIQNIDSTSPPDDNLQDPDRPNQYSRIPTVNALGSWLPGYYAQLKFVRENTPSIITVDASGNDVGFADIVTGCVLGSGTCYDSYEDRVELVNLIDLQYDRLVDMYKQLKAATVPDARIYVIGYPSVVKANGACGDNVRLNAKETVFANNLVDYLNSVIKRATERAGVQYVDVESALDGHRLCEPGYKAVNGFTFGHDAAPLSGYGIGFHFLSNGSFHPTEFGHQLLAERIEQATDNFTLPMPRADITSAGIEFDPEADELLNNTPVTGRSIKNVIYDDDMAGDMLFKDGGQNPSVNMANVQGLTPNSQMHAWLHSDPVDLGIFTADSQGSATVKLTIPKSVPVGAHMLYFDAVDATGKSVQLTKTVYVAASLDDYDGDGVPNSLEPCLIFEVPAGQLAGDDYDCTANAALVQVPTSAMSNARADATASREQVRLAAGQDTGGSILATQSGNHAVVRQKGTPIHGAGSLRFSWWLTAILITVAGALILTFLLCLRYAED